MYESILKTATDDPEFEFKVRSTPYPLTNVVRQRKVGSNSAAIMFVTAVAYGMILTNLVGHISHEIESGIKHTQIISGLHLGAYWAANFFVDFIKLELVSLISIALFYAADLKYYTASYVYLCFPIAAIPFTYVMAFMFSSVSSAQTGTMFLNFGSILFLANIVFFLRWSDSWEIEADLFHMIFKIMLPPFILGNSITFDASMEDLVEFRRDTMGPGEDLEVNPWVLSNVAGDLIILAFHCLFWHLILVAIEYELGSKLTSYCQ
jgi:hypothetical protein